MTKTNDNGNIRDMTAEEQAVFDARQTAWANDKPNRQLITIKRERLERLKATDWMANSDVTMPSYIKTWRQSLRDIPANYDSSKYDELLARDDKGIYTHAIWTQPTE
jgi:uncharacterized membrane-anchored protein